MSRRERLGSCRQEPSARFYCNPLGLDEDDFGLAVRSLRALLQQLRQSQGPLPMEEKRPLRRQPDDHQFWSLIMLGVTAGAFLLVVWAPIP